MAAFAEQCRFDLYDEIYVAPHMDDAVYSCAGRIAERRRAGARVLVVTLFGDGLQQTATKAPTIFSDYETRRAEERAAMASLDADYIWLNFPELLYRKHGAADFLRIAFPFLPLPASGLQDELGAELLRLCEKRLAPGGRAIFPFSIGFHPDHRIAFEVGRALHASGRFTVEFYEDVAYSFNRTVVALRLRYLGVPTKTSLLGSARDVNDFFFFRHNKWLRSLTFLPCLLYVSLLLLAHALLRTEDRLRGEGLPMRFSRRVDEYIEDKVSAIKLYPTQTDLFLALDDRLYDMLREGDGFYEHTWTFPPFETPNPRFSRLQAGAKQP